MTNDEIYRYSRHVLLPQVGVKGQERLKAGSVLLVGAGGLGAPLALYLAAAGVGRIGIVDFDTVDASNLQRQVLYGTSDVGRPKVEVAAERLRDLNPHVTIEPHPVRLTSANARPLVRDYDLVADGTDNFPTRYLVNDACVLERRRYVYGSIYRFEGQVAVFGAEEGPCYRCLHPNPPPPGLVPSCAEGGVVGVLPGLVGSLQATEVLKLLLGIGTPLAGKLLLVDALHADFRTLTVPRNPACPICGDDPTVDDLIDYDAFCNVPPEPLSKTVPAITVEELHARRQRGETPFVLDVRLPSEADLASLGADRLIPLNTLANRLADLDSYRNQRIIVHCRSGQRSARAVQLLRDAGFDAVNLDGGILAWRNAIDPSLPVY